MPHEAEHENNEEAALVKEVKAEIEENYTTVFKEIWQAIKEIRKEIDDLKEERKKIERHIRGKGEQHVKMAPSKKPSMIMKCKNIKNVCLNLDVECNDECPDYEIQN